MPTAETIKRRAYFQKRHKIYYPKNKERIKATTRAWQAKNKARCQATAKSWREANPGYYRDRYYSNWEKNLEAARRRYAANPKAFMERNKRWKDKNPDAFRLQMANRRGRYTTGQLTEDLIVCLWISQDGKCAVCEKELSETGYHLDHIIALARGGANEDHNIQLLCPNCNLRKGAKDPVEFFIKHSPRNL